FLSSSELLQAKKKLQDEEEAFEIAKLEYESFVNYVHPMRIEKANTTLKRASSKLEESTRIGVIKIIRDRSLLDHARAELLDLHQQLKNAEAVLLLTDIRAPSPGIVVLKEEFRNGLRRKPRVGDQVIRNQPILDLPDLDSMIVKTKVREADLYKIGIGKSAAISLDAYPQLYLKGRVLSIGVLALSDSNKMGDEKYFDIRIGLDHGDPQLRPGMTARSVILADRVNNKLSIPIHSVFEKDKKHYCYIKRGKNYLLTPIQLGASNEYWTQIDSGIEKGDEVCLSMPSKSLIISDAEKGTDK
nr:efflux RND transporter periplasmic adaptor subunit [Parachlamydiaceae bacterium]